jgi:heptosyltransferase III
MNDYVYTKASYRLAARCIDYLGSCVMPRRQVIAKPHRIVLFRLDQLGDAFYCTPFVEYLASTYPAAAIDIVTTPASTPLFEGLPGIGHIYPYAYKRFARTTKSAGIKETVRLLKTLRRNHYDIAIDMRGEPAIALMTLISGAPMRIGIAREEVLSFLYTHSIRYNPAAPAWHRFCSMLELLHIKAPTWVPRITLTESEKSQAQKIAEQYKPFIMMHLGAGVPFKRWVLESYKTVVDWAEKKGIQTVLVGGPDDTDLATTFKDSAKTHNHIGNLTIRDTYALAAHAQAVLGSDSVVVHLAGPQEVPTLHLMNSASPSSAHALGSHVQVLTGHDAHHTCTLTTCPYPCPHMKQLAAEVVIAKLKEVV